MFQYARILALVLVFGCADALAQTHLDAGPPAQVDRPGEGIAHIAATRVGEMRGRIGGAVPARSV